MFWRRLSAFVVLLVTVTLSFLPIQDKRILHTVGRFHSLGHFFIFAALTALTLGGVRNGRTRFALILGLLVLAASLEYAEHLIYGTTLEISDICIDAAGIACGGAGLVLLSDRRDR